MHPSSATSNRSAEIKSHRLPLVHDARRWALRSWLKLRVHADAFQFDPAAYLQAVIWRLRGLKVRSRNRIAPLAGRSRHAYPLWIASQPSNDGLAAEVVQQDAVQILPVIDCRFGSGLEATLASIGEAGSTLNPVLIGAPLDQELQTIARPRQLAELLPSGGAWICPLQPGDRLAPGAFTVYREAIRDSATCRVIYADDDLMGEGGVRSRPHFKPQWNPELFAHHDYISWSSLIHAEPVMVAGVPDDSWAEALLSKALAAGALPMHLPAMLHSRRSRPEPIIPPPPAEPLRACPLVSAIIPTRNQSQLLRCCIEGVEFAEYPHVEIIVVDNGSDQAESLECLNQLEDRGHKVLRRPGPFNYSALNNEAVGHATGSMLCFLNNDVEMLDQHWLSLLVRQATRPEIGAVGAMLLYPDHTIQHAGVYLGIGGGAGHAHRFQAEDEPGYFERARLPQLVSAVTGACLIVDREKFLAVDGFDEELFPVAFNDVDLCLKLNSRGWRSFYEPRARLVHHESKSRGSDSAKGNRARFAGELAALKAKWGTDRHRDPFHHPELSPYSEQFVVAI